MGMRVWVHHQGHWARGGSNFAYTRDSGDSLSRSSLTLSFTYKCEREGEVRFAAGPPLHLSELYDYFFRAERNLSGTFSYLRKRYGQSIAGLPLEYVEITALPNEGVPLHRRKVVVVLARTHPGETVGSWVQRGLLETLLSSSGSVLRSYFIFYIVPAVNPDGVVWGNSRSSLTGRDLNRQWQQPDPTWHPEIFSLKGLLLKLRQHR